MSGQKIESFISEALTGDALKNASYFYKNFSLVFRLLSLTTIKYFNR